MPRDIQCQDSALHRKPTKINHKRSGALSKRPTGSTSRIETLIYLDVVLAAIEGLGDVLGSPLPACYKLQNLELVCEPTTVKEIQWDRINRSAFSGLSH